MIQSTSLQKRAIVFFCVFLRKVAFFHDLSVFVEKHNLQFERYTIIHTVRHSTHIIETHNLFFIGLFGQSNAFVHIIT